MRKKNGFTLVELLAVIVVLAIIMIIAIPSVLDVMGTARRKSFALYVDKVVTGVQTQYVYDSNGGDIKGAGLYIYDIKTDLNLTSTGDYEGFVGVNANNVDDIQYMIFMYDKNYRISGYNVSVSGMPEADSGFITAFKNDPISQKDVCDALRIEAKTPDAPCYNRKGYELVNN